MSALSLGPGPIIGSAHSPSTSQGRRCHHGESRRQRTAVNALSKQQASLMLEVPQLLERRLAHGNAWRPLGPSQAVANSTSLRITSDCTSAASHFCGSWPTDRTLPCAVSAAGMSDRTEAFGFQEMDSDNAGQSLRSSSFPATMSPPSTSYSPFYSPSFEVRALRSNGLSASTRRSRRRGGSVDRLGGGSSIRRFRRPCFPSARETPPKRDTGIASEQEWGINLQNQPVSETGLKEDGSSWYRESGEDYGENGYRCRWNVMGGRSVQGTSEWKETWWEKSDWSGYKELGAEKSGRNAAGDSWWETWQEVFQQDELSGLARIEKSAQKQAKSRRDGMWSEKWWEKHNAKGWTEKGAYKTGRLEDHSWWEKWGEQFDGRGAVVKWTDKWAEKDTETKWGDKWEERFSGGVGTRRGETWHIAPNGNRWSRTWGEEHFGDGKVHKYGKSTTGELWDVVVNEPTYYEAEPHYGWADAVANSLQLLSIEIKDRPPPS